MAVLDRWMQRALELAALADGRQRPNPMVGAVVVRGEIPPNPPLKKGGISRGRANRRVVGEGFHVRAGGPHAEVVALQAAGARARGATLYVTLEPCCHRGRTPPCTEAIIRSGVRRVIYGMRDPNPEVAGRGAKALRAAGIEVIGPTATAACAAINPSYIHWRRTGRPYVIVKVGTTLDGKIADASGRSQWITNEAVRAYVHEWRARVDAVLVGWRTVVQDDPRLTVRLPRYTGPQPLPIVWVGEKAIPWRSRLGRSAKPVWWVVERATPAAQRVAAARGHRLIDATSVAQFLRICGRSAISALLVEGGAATLGPLLQGGWCQYAIVGLAPRLLGGQALGWTDAAQWSLPRAPHLQVEKLLRFGDNVVVEGEFEMRRRDVDSERR